MTDVMGNAQNSSKNVAHNTGNMIAISAFVLWGLFPFYFKAIAAYAPFEIIVHRFFWTGLLALIILLVLKRWSWIQQIKNNPRLLLWLTATAALMFVNTLTYVWAVNTDRVLEASFGYFICPLVAIFLAMVFLGERLNTWQYGAVALACLGVVLQLVMMGYFPLIALVVSFSFAFYGLLHKQMPIHAFESLFLETLLICPLALVYLFSQNYSSSDISFWFSKDIYMLMLAGPVTLIPLTLYNIAVKRASMTTVSFLGYLTPMIIFFLAVFYYKEDIVWLKLVSFACIWFGLLVFSMDMLRKNKRMAINKVYTS